MNQWLTYRQRHLFIALFIFVQLIFLTNLEAFSQNPNYHNFSDQRNLFGIPNFYNVVSNAAFVIVGLIGLYELYFKQSLKLVKEIRYLYVVLFISLCLLGPASGYYHLAPDNTGLFYDRLVMSVIFMSLFAIIIAEHISSKLSRYLWLPLIISGISGVSYWYLTELSGMGDLRFYVAVQFPPILLTLIILLIYPGSFDRHNGYWWMLVLYLAAKLCEYFDTEIFQMTLQSISGHTLKHLLAAIAALMVIRLFIQRNRRSPLKT